MAPTEKSDIKGLRMDLGKFYPKNMINHRKQWNPTYVDSVERII